MYVFNVSVLPSWRIKIYIYYHHHHHHHMVFLECPKQQRHHEDHYSHSKYEHEQYQSVVTVAE